MERLPAHNRRLRFATQIGGRGKHLFPDEPADSPINSRPDLVGIHSDPVPAAQGGSTGSKNQTPVHSHRPAVWQPQQLCRNGFDWIGARRLAPDAGRRPFVRQRLPEKDRSLVERLVFSIRQRDRK